MSGKTTQDDFNPRSREGSDIVYSTGLTMSNKISIHAPAKGATLQLSTLSTKTIFQSTLPRRERRKIDRLCSLRSYFNPRSREGSDKNLFSEWKLLCLFQSTLPRRERRETLAKFLAFLRNFNPRSREGSDNHVYLLHKF